MKTDLPTASPQPRRSPSFMRLVRARPRLFIAAAVGAAVIVALAPATDWRITTKLLVGWDIGVALYLALGLHMIARSDVHRMRRRAAIQDEGQLTLLVLTVSAALASLGAIFAELGTTAGGGPRHPMQLILAAVTIVLSWAFIHLVFSLHYAHEFYGEGTRGGMAFPGGEEPDYWDFVYFSFTVGMCAQVSDVTVTSKLVRRTVLVHSIVSFMFNATLLALTVNIAASAI